MGRSVSYLKDALKISYINFETEDAVYNEVWEDFKEELIESLIKICPSLDKLHTPVWDGNETRVIVENSHCQIGISEHYGLVSISIRVHTDYRTNENLAINWINQVWPKIDTMITNNYQALKKLGNFSNGEGVFEQIKPKNK